MFPAMPQPTKAVPQAIYDTASIRAAEYIAYHVAPIAPLSRLCVRYGNIASFKPRKWAS